MSGGFKSDAQRKAFYANGGGGVSVGGVVRFMGAAVMPARNGSPFNHYLKTGGWFVFSGRDSRKLREAD
jgi:hypothetical protein